MAFLYTEVTREPFGPREIVVKKGMTPCLLGTGYGGLMS